MKNDSQNQDHNDISRLLGSLKQIDPPGDFDVRVRARIAQGRPSVRRSWVPRTATVTATLLLMAAAGYFGLRSFNSPSPATQGASIVPVPVIEQPAAPQPQPQITKTAPSTEEPTRGEIALKPPTVNERVSGPARQIKTPKVDKTGGSFDITSGITKVRGPLISPKDSLSAIGVTADTSGKDWTVSDVKQNSAAERLGLKAGDVIVGGKVTGKSVRVRRDGKVVELTLKP